LKPSSRRVLAAVERDEAKSGETVQRRKRGMKRRSSLRRPATRRERCGRERKAQLSCSASFCEKGTKEELT